ncbi:uncharacterized protein LOC135925933 [Gordionus sp. m RMFG-2023]|uniref:uncharacterized protein LOC135925933 n=1 Tax=Gordionus sp. m RMFG-2023 TaxID=3053472 RepID=UPI0031FC12C3
MHDNGGDSNERIIIFATDYMLKMLAETKTCGIFLVTKKKTYTTYEVLRFYSKKPKNGIIYMDFEKAAINAVENTLGRDINIQGCFYHLTQSTHRKIQELGLESSYRNDRMLCLFAAMIDGLAFLPIHDVKRGMEYLKTIVSDENKELLFYFDKNYVNGELRHGKNSQRQVEPFFPPETWNVFNVTIAGENRTNNVCEGWNNRFKHIVGNKKPKIWELLEKIRMEIAVDMGKICQCNIGTYTPKKNRIYATKQTI